MAVIQAPLANETYRVNGRTYTSDQSGRFTCTDAGDLVLLASLGLQAHVEPVSPPVAGFGAVAVSYSAAGGSAVARTVQARLGDEPVSVADFQAVGASDDYAAFAAALATGRPVKVPYRATPYLVGSLINLFSGSVLFGEGRPTIRATSTGRVLRLNACSGVTVRGLVLDGNKGNVTAAGPLLLQNVSDCLFDDVTVLNASTTSAITGTSTANRFLGCRFIDGLGTALDFSGAGVSGNVVSKCEFQRNAGFGVRLSGGANRNLVDGCWTTSNGIELVGVTAGCSHNRVIGNHAEGTGDNGISVTGGGNVVVGNACYHNAFSGIYVYGKENVVTGNRCVGNGQVRNPAFLYYDAGNANAYAGISIGGFFGGTGQNNSISGNLCDDDQATLTQAYGVRLNAAGYALWAAATAYSAGLYLRSGFNIYLAASSGTSGATAPTHTTGTVLDGGVSWTYVDTFASSSGEPLGNVIGPNTIYRSLTAGFSDATINHNNTAFLDDHVEFSGNGAINTVTAGFRRRAQVWATGQSVKWGDIRYSDSNNVVFRVVNAGGTTANKPTHSSSTATGADGITWLAFGTAQNFNALTINTGDLRTAGVWHLPVGETTAGTVQQFSGNGTPEGKVTAPVGSIYLRADGGAGTTLYVKETGATATGWAAK